MELVGKCSRDRAVPGRARSWSRFSRSRALRRPLVAADAAHAAARADRDGTALLEAAETFAGIGALRYATDTPAEAAEALVHAGRQDSARRATAHWRALFVDGQGGSLPAIGGLDRGDRPHRRERQLVELARQGLSNAEIGERLVLSSHRRVAPLPGDAEVRRRRPSRAVADDATTRADPTRTPWPPPGRPRRSQPISAGRRTVYAARLRAACGRRSCRRRQV